MKKFWIQFGILLIVTLGSLYFYYNRDLMGGIVPSVSQETVERQLKINNSIINIEVADTASKRTKGLGERSSLATGSGMLFVFPEEKKYQFWMKGMKFPLDLIFIKQGKVVDFLRNVPSPVSGQNDSSLPIYEPVVPIDMALEVNAGFIDSQNIHIGDTVFLIKQ